MHPASIPNSINNLNSASDMHKYTQFAMLWLLYMQVSDYCF